MLPVQSSFYGKGQHGFCQVGRGKEGRTLKLQYSEAAEQAFKMEGPAIRCGHLSRMVSEKAITIAKSTASCGYERVLRRNDVAIKMNEITHEREAVNS